MNILAAIANDPNISPAFRRLFATQKSGPLEVAHAKADARRFAADPVPLTGFGPLDGADGLEPVICGDCDGSGEGMHDGASCKTCGGEGEILELAAGDADDEAVL